MIETIWLCAERQDVWEECFPAEPMSAAAVARIMDDNTWINARMLDQEILPEPESTCIG